MSKKKFKETYVCKCTITGQEFITTKRPANPEELISVKAYYQLHQDEDDRPEKIKMRLASAEANTPSGDESDEQS